MHHIHIHSEHAHKFHVYLHQKRVNLSEKKQRLFHAAPIAGGLPGRQAGGEYTTNPHPSEVFEYDSDSIFHYCPSEVLLHIMTYLPFVDICALSLTNRQLAILASNENLWKEMFNAKYDINNSDAYATSQQQMYGFNTKSFPNMLEVGLNSKVPTSVAIQAELTATWKSMYYNCYRKERNWKGEHIHEKLVWGHSAGIWAVKIRDNTIVSASADCSVRLWEMQGKKVRCNKVLRGHTGVVKCIDYDPVLGRVASGSCDGSVRVWDVSKGKKKCTNVLTGHTNWVRGVQATGDLLVSASSDRTLKAWNLTTGECIQTFDGHTNYVRSLQFEDNRLVSGSADGTIRVWDMNTGQTTGTFRSPSACAVRDFQFEGNKLVSAFADSVIRIWDLNLASPSGTNDNHAKAITGELTGHTLPLWCLRFEGHRLVSGSADRSVRVWDMRKMECLHTLGGHTLPVWGVDMQGCTVVSGGADRLIKVWDFSG